LRALLRARGRCLLALSIRAGRLLQTATALGGAAAGLAGVFGALGGDGPAEPWVLHLFAAWCVVTPYWWYLEYRLLAPSGARARRDFLLRQSYSRQVWLGILLAMGVPIIARGT
jgi:hypothetical protein